MQILDPGKGRDPYSSTIVGSLRKEMKQKLGLLAAALLFLAVIAWAFYPKPFDVDVAEICVGYFERAIEDSGKTRLRDRYTVSAPVAGKLSRLTAREGDLVQAG